MRVKGVTIIPEPDGEAFSFTFDRDGAVRSLMGMISILDGSTEPEEAWVSIKTQFVGPEFHTWVVGLLKYLKKKYMSDLEVRDESEYWESGDLDKLKEKMVFLYERIDFLTNRLNRGVLGDTTVLSAEEIADRIERVLRDLDNDDTGNLFFAGRKTMWPI